MSSTNNHLWKPAYIGRVNKQKQFDIVWQEREPIRPFPYPPYRSRNSWQSYLDDLHENWGGWAAPTNEAENSEVTTDEAATDEDEKSASENTALAFRSAIKVDP